jgi:Domain of unknown function (DUF4352)
MSRGWCRRPGWCRCWRWPSGLSCGGWPTSGSAEKGQYDVTIKVTSGSYSYNPFDFQEQSGNGQIWQPTFAIGFDPALNAGTAAAGHTARGNVVFDVPRGPIQIQLTGGLGQSTAAAWNG